MNPVTIAALIEIAFKATSAAERITGLIQRCIREGREPTPEEVDDVKQRQNNVEKEWALIGPKTP